MTDAEPLFVDTNVLVYANVAGSPFHEQALTAIQAAHRSGRPLWISRQVLPSRVLTFWALPSPGFSGLLRSSSGRDGGVSVLLVGFGHCPG